MSELGKSLLYDVIAVAILLTLALLAHGTARGLLAGAFVGTVLNAPYDAWKARRRDQNR